MGAPSCVPTPSTDKRKSPASESISAMLLNAELSTPSVIKRKSAWSYPPLSATSTAAYNDASTLLPYSGNKSGDNTGTILTMVLLSSVNGETVYESPP